MATLDVYGNGGWNSLCDGANIEVRDGVTWQPLQAGDHVFASGTWQELCPVPDPVYSFGFDMPNRDITIIGGFPNIGFQHTVSFRDSSNSYPFSAEPFVVRTTVNAQVDTPDGEVWIRAYNQIGTLIWQFGPAGPGGYVNLTYDFIMNSVNTRMDIVALFQDGDAFQLSTINQGGSPFIDWSGVPFPVDYNSNS